MNVSQQIIDVLNKDEKARKVMAEFNRVANEQGIEGEEYAKAREITLLLCMHQNKEVMGLMANEIWEEVNGGKA